MKCFYHNDLDGKCAASCIRLSTENSSEDDYVALDYGTPFPFDSITDSEQVWIVDYSLEPSDMDDLLEITDDVIWIDHHKTAIEKYKGYEKEIKGIRWAKYAGCVLTYAYIHLLKNGQKELDDEIIRSKVPYYIRLVGDRDTWRWEHRFDSAHFYFGASSFDAGPTSDLWDKLDDEEFLKSVMKDGELVCRYRNQNFLELREVLAFETEFEGYKAMAMNVAKTGSEAFGGPGSDAGGLRPGYDLLIPFYFDGEQFTVSLYSKSIDTSVLSEKHGGGGHPGASGFQCDKLPFEKTGDFSEE